MNRIKQSYDILDKLLLPNGMYLASTSSDYHYTWLRDTFNIAMAYLNKNDGRYEKTYHGILDILKKYSNKIEGHRPHEDNGYLHIRYDAANFEEVDTPWGHVQYDAYGAVLFGIGEGIRVGKKIIRDDSDREVIQKFVGYLERCRYWEDEDSGAWEENRELRASSIGAVVAGLLSISKYVYVPSELIAKGYSALYKLFPKETETRNVDLAQLFLIYPYNILPKPLAQKVIHNVETELLRSRGVLRYKGDSYYSTLEPQYGRHQNLEVYYGSEAEWTFGFSFLALSHMTLGNYEEANKYIYKAESVMLEDGGLPELYFAHSDKYNGNTPLAWSNAMYIIAKEKYSMEELRVLLER